MNLIKNKPRCTEIVATNFLEQTAKDYINIKICFSTELYDILLKIYPIKITKNEKYKTL